MALERNESTYKKASLMPFATKGDNAPAYWLVNCLWIILVDGKDTDGRFSLLEQHMPLGSAPIPHVHNFTDEWFYILDGSMDALVGGQEITAKTGDTLWIPRGTVHSFKVTSEICRVLNAYEPAGVEQTIMSLAQPAERRELPPKGPMPDQRTLFLLFNHYWTAEASHPWAHGVPERKEKS
jgi:quercetin dioxygenase-like cupin family protein